MSFGYPRSVLVLQFPFFRVLGPFHAFQPGGRLDKYIHLTDFLLVHHLSTRGPAKAKNVGIGAMPFDKLPFCAQTIRFISRRDPHRPHLRGHAVMHNPDVDPSNTTSLKYECNEFIKLAETVVYSSGICIRVVQHSIAGQGSRANSNLCDHTLSTQRSYQIIILAFPFH